jgi:hypothetical protein
VNSTISGNSAGFYGGGIGSESTSAVLSVSFSTISGNLSATSGFIGSGDETGNFNTATVKNSILANSSATGGNCHLGTAITSGGGNLSDDSSCTPSFSQATDINNMPAGLDTGGLQLNAPGTTKTIALLSTSLAVNAIPPAACTDVSANPVTTDQRGVSRPQGTNCDIGAYELVSTQAAATITFGPAPTPTYLGPNFTVSATTNSDGALTFSRMSGPCTFVSQTATTGTFSSSGAGTCVVKATTPATANFTAGSNTQNVSIAAATPAITFGTAPTPTFPGSNFTVSATTNSDGALTFTAMSGPCTFVSQTATTGTFSSSGTGTCVVKASTPATTNFTAGSNTQNVIISAVSPAQLVTNLVTTVQGMNITGQGTSLTDQLNQVETDITTNNGLACQDLLLFVNHVKAQRGKKITIAQANQLLAAAAAIQAALGC